MLRVIINENLIIKWYDCTDSFPPLGNIFSTTSTINTNFSYLNDDNGVNDDFIWHTIYKNLRENIFILYRKPQKTLQKVFCKFSYKLFFVHSQISPVLYFTARPEQGRGITEYKIVNNIHTLETRFILFFGRKILSKKAMLRITNQRIPWILGRNFKFLVQF